MSGQIIAIANSKGGVGKTTTTVALAEAFAAEGRRALVLDLDAQANASMLVFGANGDERLFRTIREERTVSDYLDENFVGGEPKALSAFVTEGASDVSHRGTVLPLDLIASSPRLRRSERWIIYELTKQNYSMSAIEGRVGNRLRNDLGRLSRTYDVILCDCPPGISAMTEAILMSADLIIVPTIPDFMSTLGLDLFTGDVMKGLERQGNARKPHVLATRFANTAHQRIVLEAMRDGAAADETEYVMFDTVVPSSEGFSVNPVELGESPTLDQKWSGDGLAVLDSLLGEVKEALA